jgi:hypothetical protein
MAIASTTITPGTTAEMVGGVHPHQRHGDPLVALRKAHEHARRGACFQPQLRVGWQAARKLSHQFRRLVRCRRRVARRRLIGFGHEIRQLHVQVTIHRCLKGLQLERHLIYRGLELPLAPLRAQHAQPREMAQHEHHHDQHGQPAEQRVESSPELH